MFWNQEKSQLRSLQRELHSIELKQQIALAKSTLAAAKDQALYVPPSLRKEHVQESIIDTLYGIPSLRALTGYTDLIQVPFMVREQFPYKQTIIRSIIQLDFIRFIGRLLEQECPTFSAVIQALEALVFGSSGLTIQAYSLEADENQELVEEVNEVIRKSDEYNDFSDWQKEIHRRYHVEGEAFLNVRSKKSMREDEPSELRIIEPDFVRPSVLKGQNHEDPNIAGMKGEDWSFGINNKPSSWYKPLKFNIVYPPEWELEEVIQAEDMFHIKYAPHRSNKRGVPTCFKLVDDLIRVTVLREALATGSIQRARITGVLEYETNIDTGYVKSDLSKLAKPSDNKAFEVNPVSSYHDVDNEQAHFLGILPGRKFTDYPVFDAESANIIYTLGIQTIASYYSLPLSVFGLAGDSSFASSLTEETIPTRRRESEQGLHCALWEKIVKRIVELDYDGGEDLWDKIGIKVTGPSLVIRDVKSEVESHVSKVNAKLESRKEAMTELGLDPKEQLDQMEEEADIEVLQEVVQEPAKEISGKEPETSQGIMKKEQGPKEERTSDHSKS